MLALLLLLLDNTLYRTSSCTQWLVCARARARAACGFVIAVAARGLCALTRDDDLILAR